IVSSSVANKTYDGGTDAQVSAGTLAGVVDGDSVSVAGSGEFADKNAGIGKQVTVTYQLSGTDSGNYIVAGETLSADILAKVLQVVGSSVANKTYDGSTAATVNAGTLSGLVAGETLGLDATGVFDSPNAGAYTVTVQYTLSDGGGLASNYILADTVHQATIDPRAITVTAGSLSKTYGDADPTLGWSVTAGNLVGQDTLIGTLSRASGENVGSYVIDASGLSNGNYLVTAHNGTLTIDPRAITVTAGSLSKTYGDADPTLGWSVTAGNLVGDDTLIGTLSRAGGENVGSYVIDASGLSNGNYLVTAHNGTLTIDPRTITVTAGSLSKTYGDADPTLGWSVTAGNLVGQDTLIGTLTRASGENVGSYVIDASGLSNGNYLVTAHNGTLTIDPRAITVTAGSLSKTYGDADPTLGWSVTAGNLVGDDTLIGTLSRASGENVGSYVIDASGLSNGNYLVTAHNGTLTIDPRAITVTAGSLSKTYGDADPTLGWSVTAGNLVGQDTLNGTLTRASGENVGSYVIDASGLANGNYLVTAHNGTLTIDPRAITVTAGSLSKTYGDADPTLGWSVTAGNLVGDDTLNGTLTRAGGENVGSYVIDASGLANGNYLVTAHNGTLTIDPRAITVTADSLSKIYGSSDPALTWQVTQGNLIGNDVLNGALVRESGEGAGRYVIDASALSNGNYLITAVDGVLIIQDSRQTDGAIAAAQALPAVPPVRPRSVEPGVGPGGLEFVALAPEALSVDGVLPQADSGTAGFARVLVVEGGIHLPSQTDLQEGI
ncbi:MBG domain-containing protein, partial [Stutzerimonas tarimensis]